MAKQEQSVRKTVKVGVRRGAGEAPGYEWTVLIFDVAHDEALEFLTDAQLEHMQAHVRELAKLAEPTRSATIDVRPVEDIWEIRDKGGVLKKIAARVFFGVDHDSRRLIVLGSLKKENDGQTPVRIKIEMHRRMRDYFQRFRGMEF